METWRRNQLVTTAVVFVVFTGFAFVLPFLPLYVQELGVADPEAAALWAGVLIGVAPLLAGLLAPAWGRHADQHGRKRTVLRALACYVVLLALSALVTRVEQLLLLRIGIGLFGGIGPLGLAMATALAPREETGRAVGAIQSAQILSSAFGPLAGGFLAAAIGIRLTFLVTSGLCALAWILLFGLYQEGPRPAASEHRAAPPLRDLLGLPRVLGLLGVLFLVNFVGRSFTPILALHLGSLGVAPGRIAFFTGVVISAYSVVAAASAGAMGGLARRFSPELLLCGSLVAGAGTVLPLAQAGTFASFLGWAIALGLFSGGALTLCYTLGGLAVPGDRRGAAFGLFSGAALFGGALSPSFAGGLAHWDFRLIYPLDALLFLGVAAAVVPWVRAGRGVR